MHEVEGRVQGIVREYAQKSLSYLRPVEVARGLVAEAPYVLDIVHIGAHLGRPTPSQSLLIGAERAPLAWTRPGKQPCGVIVRQYERVFSMRSRTAGRREQRT